MLQPSYDQLSAAIREVQTDALVFFAAVTWDDIVPAGFTAAPGKIVAYTYLPVSIGDGQQ